MFQHFSYYFLFILFILIEYTINKFRHFYPSLRRLFLYSSLNNILISKTALGITSNALQIRFLLLRYLKKTHVLYGNKNVCVFLVYVSYIINIPLQSNASFVFQRIFVQIYYYYYVYTIEFFHQNSIKKVYEILFV